MDKKRLLKVAPTEDIKGFEEFVEGQPNDTSFLPKPVQGTKKENSFEHFTFLKTDGERLIRLKRLLNEKLPFAAKFEQGNALLKEQREEVQVLQKKIFELCDNHESAYRKSLEEIFDAYYSNPESST